MLVNVHMDSYFSPHQVHAIHPDCAIISQLIQDQEICIQTRKREIKNQSQQTGRDNIIIYTVPIK